MKPFSEEIGVAEGVPIVDGAISYDDPISGKTYVLLVRNALYIQSMPHNLIPPFIMRMRGVIVNDVPKIHCKEQTVRDHAICFEDIDLRIQLHLQGIFSVFHHRAPTTDELHQCDKVFMTPDSASWNPHCNSFARNEESMLDFEGNIAQPSRRTRHLMEPDKDDSSMPEVSALDWDSAVDANVSTSFQQDELDNPDEVSNLAEALSLRGEISKIFRSIGSCNADSKTPDDIFQNKPIYTSLDDIEAQFSKDIAPTVSAAHADIPKGVKK